MPRFKVGDHVERVGTLVPDYIKNGIVIRVIPNQEMDWFSRYEVELKHQQIAIFYETQLRLVKSAEDPT